MQIKQLTFLLITLAALFLAFGALLNLWFYAAAGLAVALYLTWRFFAFQGTVTTLHLDIRRNVDKSVVRRGGRVTVEVSVSSPTPVEGRFTDELPSGVELVDGATSAYLQLRPGVTSTWRYTLVAVSRETVEIERAAFILDNGLFVHTILFAAAAREVTQPPYAVSVESGVGGIGGTPGVSSTSVRSLYRARRTGAGFEVSHLRPFAVGDPLKHIHWKASAKLNQLMTKEFLTELEDAAGAGTSVSLIIDQSGTMGRGPPGATELDFAVNIAGHFVKSAVATGNRIGLVTYDDDGVATSLAGGYSLPHVSSVVRSLNELEPSVPLRRPRRKVEVTGSDVIRIKKHFDATRGEEDDDVRRFRHVVSYLYAHGEGYTRSLQKSPAFRAIAASLQRLHGPSTIVLVSDLENDFSPLSEGIRLASRRGMQVYVIALFSEVFQRFEDPLIALEDVYAQYDAHRMRIQKLEHISNVKVIEANDAETLQPVLKEAQIA
jgi:uncharacterized protein (DUF58 family)